MSTLGRSVMQQLSRVFTPPGLTTVSYAAQIGGTNRTTAIIPCNSRDLFVYEHFGDSEDRDADDELKADC